MAEEKGVLSGFREFVLRGNVVDLAVAVVLGAAFGVLVTALVEDVLTPLIAAIVGKPDFSALYFKINGSHILYGSLINALIAFVSVAAAIYFFVVVPINKLAARRAAGVTEPESILRPCPECLTEVPKAAIRCAACTAQLQAVV